MLCLCNKTLQIGIWAPNKIGTRDLKGQLTKRILHFEKHPTVLYCTTCETKLTNNKTLNIAPSPPILSQCQFKKMSNKSFCESPTSMEFPFFVKSCHCSTEVVSFSSYYDSSKTKVKVFVLRMDEWMDLLVGNGVATSLRIVQ